MPLQKLLLTAFALLPVAEIATFVLVAWGIGVLRAFALLLAAMLAGVLLLRHAGRTQIVRLRVVVSDQRVDAFEFEGLEYVVGGILLLIPGFLTDIAALLLLIPPIRALLAAALGRAVAGHAPRSGPTVVDLDEREWQRVPDPQLEPRRDGDGR